MERFYRNSVRTHLHMTRVVVQQTDLGIYSNIRLEAAIAKDAAIEHRGYLEAYMRRHPEFMHALAPLPDDPLAPAIARKMIRAGRAAQVGPMAAVAGAMAEQVGQSLLNHVEEVVVENGGDIFLCVRRPLTIGIYAGASPLSLKVGLRISPGTGIKAVCTSSGTVGHSLSFGRADAVCVLSSSCALADAAATAIGNRVGSSKDIRSAIAWGEHVEGLIGILIIKADQMAAWGQLEVVPL
ncbi:MAG: UPF0280 family protein [Desulfobacteraceae bacterium]|nr:MAG: UPF0280 family protein [Desulfobacteraceae bacterium]